MKAVKLFTFLALMLMFTISAYGETFTYTPASVVLELAPGESSTIDLTIVSDVSRYAFTTFVATVAGELPPFWLSANPPRAGIMPLRTALTISVPADAAPGRYSGILISDVQSSSHDRVNNQGIGITVTVKSSGCLETPELNTSFSPKTIWAPNNSMQDIVITGTVDAPDGCTISNAKYSIEDEYGVFSKKDVPIALDGNSFRVAIPVEASRKGNDKDGRLYTIIISASDEKGEKSNVFSVMIAHDQKK